MSEQLYALEPGQEKRLGISWKGFYTDVVITLDGQFVGVISNPKALTAGQEFQLKDGSIIKVKLANRIFASPELRVLRNGQPLPGSASDPQTKLRNAYGMVYFIAGLNLVFGFISYLFNVELLQQIGIGLDSMVYGFVFLALGFFVQRKSLLALILAILIFVLDGVAGFYFAALQGYNPGGAGIVARIILLIPMIQGLSAIMALKKIEA